MGTTNTNMGKTFKVTFFDKELDIFRVRTYHNVTNQNGMLTNVALTIHVLELHRGVKCITTGVDSRSYTKVFNELLQYELNELERQDREAIKAIEAIACQA